MPFKSKGEEAIAQILDDDNIKYIYEHPMLVNEQKKGDTPKLRIWYPDFWLPEHSIVIEFFGMKGKQGYDEETIKKKAVYKEMYIKLIPVYPNTIQKNLKAYLLKSISGIIDENRQCFDNRNKRG